MAKEYLTEREAAELLGLTRKALQSQRTKRRGLPYHKIGKRVLYKIADIDQFMNRNRHQMEAI